MRYSIWIVTPKLVTGQLNPHSACFAEVAQSLRAAFVELGHECEISSLPPITRDNVIILGAHMLHPEDMAYLNRPIIWQLEQMPDESDGERARAPWTETYLQILRRADVWDYSRVNIATLASHGISARLLEIGYMPVLTRIENNAVPDIDVLFIGSMSQRRAHVLQGLDAAGVKVVHAFDCYGVKRDMLVARAKLVVNVHFYPAKIFEVVRCSYLLANRKAVVSEIGLDSQLEDPYVEGINFSPYDGLVDSCLSLLMDDARREGLAQRGYDVMRGMSQTEKLKAVL